MPAYIRSGNPEVTSKPRSRGVILARFSGREKKSQASSSLNGKSCRLDSRCRGAASGIFFSSGPGQALGSFQDAAVRSFGDATQHPGKHQVMKRQNCEPVKQAQQPLRLKARMLADFGGTVGTFGQDQFEHRF